MLVPTRIPIIEIGTLARIEISPYNSARIDSGSGNFPPLYRLSDQKKQRRVMRRILPAVQSGEVRLSMRAYRACSRSHVAASDDFPEPESTARRNAARSLT